MGKLDVSLLQYLTKEDFRVLIAIEMGMKNHELVPGPLVSQLANLRAGGVFKKLKNDICMHRLASYERGKHYDGYRLTNRGYDYLALKSLSVRNTLIGVGSQIGVGKESDIYVVIGPEEKLLCMKLHRLGRTSFRKLKEKRDYHKGRQMSWIYLNRLSATKEYAFMKALYERGFPVPEPVDVNRHCIIMQLVDGYQLHQVHELKDPAQLHNDLMELIVRFANNGVIHGDFNEFNIMITSDDKPIVIDFPQMISTSHQNAKMYFDRDVQCIVTFFKKRFDFESEHFPDFERDVKKEFDLDKVIQASGYNNEIMEFNMMLHLVEENEDSSADYNTAETNVYDTAEEVSDSELPQDEDNSISDECDEDSDGDSKNNVESDRCLHSVVESASNDENSYDVIRTDAEKVTFNSTINMYFESMPFFRLEQTSSNENSFSNEIYSHDSSHCKTAPMSDPLNIDKSIKCPDLTEEMSHINSKLLCHDETCSVTSKTSRLSKFKNTGQKLDEETRTALKEKLVAASRIQKCARRKGEPVPNLAELMEECKLEDDRLSCYSFSTTASSVNPALLRQRAQRDFEKKESKQVSKKNLRVKGEANAYARKKKENSLNIKQTMECADIWM